VPFTAPELVTTRTPGSCEGPVLSPPPQAAVNTASAAVSAIRGTPIPLLIATLRTGSYLGVSVYVYATSPVLRPSESDGGYTFTYSTVVFVGDTRRRR
jgi:hypothetical protein